MVSDNHSFSMQNNKWDVRFLRLAEFISKWSLDPSTKVGAVIVDENRRVVSVGYNGLPMGVEDTEERLNNRDLKYKIIVHGERNAILFAARPLYGCTLYTWPFMPCATCASMIIQSGITRVVSVMSDNPRWNDEFALSKEILKEAGLSLDLLDASLPMHRSHVLALPGPVPEPWYKRWFSFGGESDI